MKTDDLSFKREKTAEKKKEKGVKKNVIDTPCKSNINTVIEEHFSPDNIETNGLHCCQSTIIKYIQPAFKPSNKLKLLKKYFYQKYLS